MLDYQNNPVVAYVGTGTSLFVEWDGTDVNGFEVPDGFYDYYIVAVTTGSDQMSSMTTSSTDSITQSVMPLTSVGVKSANVSATPLARPPQRLLAAARVPFLHEFARDRSVLLPASDHNALSLKPAAPSTNATETSLLQLLPPGLEEAIGADAFAEVVKKTLEQDAALRASESQTESFSLAAQGTYSPQGAGPLDAGQTNSTDFPIRTPGRYFKGFAGAFGVGYQGHHPSIGDYGPFGYPSGAHGFTSIWAPFGPLRNASAIANGFSTHMTSSGWRQAFMLADDGFKYSDLTGDYTPPNRATSPGTFTTNISMGLVVGHVVAANTTPFGASMCYYPFWISTNNGLAGNPHAYDWISMAEMDFGSYLFQHGGWSPLKWMGIYGCNSLRLTDVNDMWTKFYLPMQGNLRLLLGTDSAVYIIPEFGSQYADDLNGVSTVSGGSPMSIVQSWYDAAGVASTIASHSRNPFKRPHNPIVMSVVYRDPDTSSGLAGTKGDSIWSYPPNYNVDWAAISWESSTVYTP